MPSPVNPNIYAKIFLLTLARDIGITAFSIGNWWMSDGKITALNSAVQYLTYVKQ